MLADCLPQSDVALAMSIMCLPLVKGRADRCLNRGRDVEIGLTYLQMYDINALASISRALSRTSMTINGAISSALLAVKFYILLLSSLGCSPGNYPIIFRNYRSIIWGLELEFWRNRHCDCYDNYASISSVLEKSPLTSSSPPWAD